MKTILSITITLLLLVSVWMPVLADDTWCGDSVCPPLDTVPPESCVALGTCPTETIQIIYETWCGEDVCPPQYVDGPSDTEYVTKANQTNNITEHRQVVKRMYYKIYKLTIPY